MLCIGLVILVQLENPVTGINVVPDAPIIYRISPTIGRDSVENTIFLTDARFHTLFKVKEYVLVDNRPFVEYRADLAVDIIPLTTNALVDKPPQRFEVLAEGLGITTNNVAKLHSLPVTRADTSERFAVIVVDMGIRGFEAANGVIIL
jgi:hypothetical protein